MAPADKFQEALARARALAAERGIELTDDQWRALLEVAVHEINRFKGDLVKDEVPAVDQMAASLELRGGEGQ